MKQSVLQKLKSKWKNSNAQTNQILDDEPLLWLKPEYTREEAESYLNDKEIGVFVIRKSETILDCYVLSVKVPKFLNGNEVSHYLIQKNKKSFQIRGFSKEFNDLKSLVTHCSFMRDILPIMLNLNFYKTQIELNERKLNDFYYYSSSKSSLTSTVSCSSVASSSSQTSSASSF